MQMFDAIVSWLFLAFGATHCIMGILFSPTKEPLWFLSGGLAMLFLAALNLLRVYYGRQIRALNWISMIGNLMVLALFLAIALHLEVPLLKAPQVLTGVLLVALLVHFSVKQTVTPPTPKGA